MKKTLIITAIVLGVLLAAAGTLYFLVSSDKLQPIDVRFKQIDISIDDGILDMNFHTSMDNPRSFIFHPSRLAYQVYFDTTQIAGGGRSIMPCDTCTDAENDTFQMPLTLNLDSINSKLRGADRPDSTDLKIKMQLYFDLFGLGLKELPIGIEREIKTPNPPEVKIDEVEVETLKLDTLALKLKGRLINKNSFSVRLNYVDISVDFKDLFQAYVELQDTFLIKANESSEFEAIAEVEELQLVRDAFKVLFTVKDKPYTLSGAIEMQLDTAKRPIQLNLSSEGEAKLKPWKRSD